MPVSAYTYIINGLKGDYGVNADSNISAGCGLIYG